MFGEMKDPSHGYAFAKQFAKFFVGAYFVFHGFLHGAEYYAGATELEFGAGIEECGFYAYALYTSAIGAFEVATAVASGDELNFAVLA